MKRIGRILFCLLPLLITLGLQNLISIPICGITAAAAILQNHGSEISFMELYRHITSLWTTSTFTLVLSMSYALAALVLFGFWYKKKFTDSQELVSVPQTFNRWIVLALLLLAVGLQYVTSYLMTFVAVLRPDWMQAYESLMETAGFKTLSPLLIIYSCIIAPVSEELIFRGVTFGYAKKALPLIGAVGLQAVLFGVFHMNIIQGIYAAFLGLFLGYLCETGGTVAIPMLMHAFFNICGTCLNSYLFFRMDHPFFFLFWLTAGVLLTFAGIFLFQYGIVIRDKEASLS